MTGDARVRAEWVVELGSGPFKSRSHLVNHLDMLFPRDELAGPSGQIRRFALVGVDDAPQWRTFDGFDSVSEVKRAREHVLARSHDAEAWSQVEIAVALTPDGEPDWEVRVPEDVTRDEIVQITFDAIEIWADLLGVSFDDLLESSSCFVLLLDWDALVLDRVSVRSFGTTDVPLKMNDRRAMQAGHGDSVPWRAFAFGVCRSESVKRALAERQSGECPVCNERLRENAVVHHVDYDHECAMAVNGASPDCERCMVDDPGLAEERLEKLCLVHLLCNRTVEGDYFGL